jgi:peptide/nickel transport system permease protein
VFLAFTSLLAVIGPWIAPYGAGALSADPFQPPGRGHWMGSDNVGKDILSEIIHGTRVTVMVGVVAAGVSLLIGVLVGSIAGFAGGRVDATLMRIAEFFQILPGLLLALVVAAIMGRSIGLLILAIAVTSWPQSARLVRAQFLSLREREFVEAARGIGFPRRYIVGREILPNAMPPAIVQATLDVGTAILIAASLSFLGLGDPTVPSWGEMLNNAQGYLDRAWWMAVFPGAAIFLVVLATNVVGDGVTDALDPKAHRREE